ncbi:50S ribosomal protein L10 [Bacteroides propionicifaciens]|jgi:large subunit ribosomal protein L10|uniref:50S ribosomal protein L10 n=1 Tax=Bacteroides propionicifaciens TaxID=392838 RepID=UPI00036E2443|nr:50S ribosomal protein L10 [Bacteroides propionicifaciens]
MRKEDKGLIIEQLASSLGQYEHFYLVDTTAMNSADTSALRRACYKKEVKLVVVKNSLLRKAFESISEVDYSPLFDTLTGTTAIMLTHSASLPAKLIKEVANKKTGIPALKAAYAEESFYVGAEHLDTLVSIKSKDEVIADIVALLQSPAKNVISALKSGGDTIHGVLKTLGDK